MTTPTNSTMPGTLARLQALAAAFALAACGGGGLPAASVADNATDGGSPVGEVPTDPYAGKPDLRAALDWFNAQRTACGFGPVEQNTLLDTAAQNHAGYMAANRLVTHTETPGQPGFTGASVADRIAYAAYPVRSPGASEVASAGRATPLAALRDLSAAPYHQKVLYSMYRDLGMGWAASDVGVNYFSANLAVQNTQTVPPVTNAPLTFPCQGTTDVVPSGSNEIPAPTIAGTAIASPWGTPIFVLGERGSTVDLRAATITSAGVVTPMQLMTKATDSNNQMFTNTALAIPPAALAPDTVYAVSLTGTYNGAPFTRDFTFTTGH